MSDEREFHIRPGRIRSTSAQRTRPFIAQALASAQRAGGRVARNGIIGSNNRSRFGRGQRASIQANRHLSSRSRQVVIKTRIVQHKGRTAPLGAHLDYLQRDGVTRDGDDARLFGPENDREESAAFAERCQEDRHHFRFIVSPEDSADLSDLKTYARDLMAQAEKDLGTKLDWVGVDHWNTEHPHVHIILRGQMEDGQDLVISRDYISEGMRARACDLATLELGPRTDLDIGNALERQIHSERWTDLDRQLARDADRNGIIDMAPDSAKPPDAFHVQKMGRLRKLESLGLAHELGPGQWSISDSAQQTLRELGERGDIIKRIHRSLTERGIERSASSYVLAGENADSPIIGRLIDRGLDNELKGSAYVVIDGVDGRTHHVKLPHLDAAGDSALGSIVELRTFDDAKGERRVAVAVRSDFPIERQIEASGATWLDRQAISNAPLALGSGFGAEVQDAMERRAEHLIEQGLAQRQGRSVIFARRLIDTLRRRELDTLAQKIASETGLAFQESAVGEHAAGLYRQRFNLASGRYAMIDDGMGFQLAPWTPALEKKLGQHVSGVTRKDGGVDWSFAQKRGLGL